MVDVSIIIFLVVYIAMTIIVNLRILYYYEAEENKESSFFQNSLARLASLMALELCCLMVLLLPVDAYNINPPFNLDTYIETTAGLQMSLFWDVVWWLSAVVLCVLVPFAISVKVLPSDLYSGAEIFWKSTARTMLITIVISALAVGGFFLYPKISKTLSYTDICQEFPALKSVAETSSGFPSVLAEPEKDGFLASSSVRSLRQSSKFSQALYSDVYQGHAWGNLAQPSEDIERHHYIDGTSKGRNSSEAPDPSFEAGNIEGGIFLLRNLYPLDTSESKIFKVRGPNFVLEADTAMQVALNTEGAQDFKNSWTGENAPYKESFLGGFLHRISTDPSAPATSLESPTDIIALCDYLAGINGGQANFELVISPTGHLVIIMTLVSWIIFAFFGGIGVALLPSTLVLKFSRRPRELDSEKIRATKTQIGKKAQYLKELYVLFEGEKNLSKSKFFVGNWKTRNLLKNEVYILEEEYNTLQELEKFEENPSILWMKFFGGILLSLLSLAWVTQVILTILREKLFSDSSDKWTSFFGGIDQLLMIFVQHNLALVALVAYLLLVLYLLICVIYGCFQAGLRVFFLVPIHPIRKDNTSLTSILVNSSMLLLSSCAVLHLTQLVFWKFSAMTTAALFFRVYANSIPFLKLVMDEIFLYIFLGITLISFIYTLVFQRFDKSTLDEVKLIDPRLVMCYDKLKETSSSVTADSANSKKNSFSYFKKLFNTKKQNGISIEKSTEKKQAEASQEEVSETLHAKPLTATAQNWRSFISKNNTKLSNRAQIEAGGGNGKQIEETIPSKEGICVEEEGAYGMRSGG